MKIYGQALYKNLIKTRDALFKHVEPIWKEMRISPCENLASFMKIRLNSVTDKGGHTKYK